MCTGPQLGLVPSRSWSQDLYVVVCTSRSVRQAWTLWSAQWGLYVVVCRSWSVCCGLYVVVCTSGLYLVVCSSWSVRWGLYVGVCTSGMYAVVVHQHESEECGVSVQLKLASSE